MGSSSKPIINSLKLLTFDATGTLLKFRKPPIEIYMDFGKRHGLETDEQKMKKSFRQQWTRLNDTEPHFGECWKSWWTQFVVGTYKGSGVTNVEDSTLNSIAAELIDHFRTPECWEVKPGAEELLSELSKYQKSNPSICVAVISNFDPRLRELLRTVGISDYFKFLVLSHESRVSKPSKAIFQWTLEMGSNIMERSRRPLLPNQCLHVGDNYKLDYGGATGAGWMGALVIPKEEWGQLELDISIKDKIPVFNTISEFGDYLFGKS